MTMRVLVMIAVVCACALALLFSYKAANAQRQRAASPFVADTDNKTSLSVKGWEQAELGKIVADFSKQYDLPSTAMKIRTQSSKAAVMTFPNDIEPRLLFFLVNYVQYPNGFDLKGRSIAAVAHVILTPAFGVPDSMLIGKPAEIYVPAHDTEYDLVYAQVGSQKAYRIPFTNLIWQAAADARVPAAIGGL